MYKATCGTYERAAAWSTCPPANEVPGPIAGATAGGPEGEAEGARPHGSLIIVDNCKKSVWSSRDSQPNGEGMWSYLLVTRSKGKSWSFG